MNHNDIPKAKTGLSGLFNAKRNHSIVIPESMVVSAEAYFASKRERSSRDRRGQQQAGDPLPNPQDPVRLAREFKMTETEFEEQKRAMKEHEEQKRKRDQQKAKREVKWAVGESITAAEQQRVLDEIKSQAETGRKQGSPDQSTLDVGCKGMKRQRSLQPHVYDNIPGGAGNDSGNIHRRRGNQGKSSSIAQGEGCGERFQIENAAVHAGHHGGVGSQADHDSRGYRDHGSFGGGPPYAGDHERAQVHLHEYLHESNQYQGAPPPQPQQHGDNRYHSNHGRVHVREVKQESITPAEQQLLLDEVRGKHGEQQSPNLQQSFLDVDRQHLLQSSDSANDQHHIDTEIPEGESIQSSNSYPRAHLSHDSQPKLVDKTLSEHEHSPGQHQLAAPPSSGQPDTTHNHLTEAARNSSTPSSSALHLTAGSRVQMPTQSPIEPFRYGVIRWIGTIPPMQGLVAGIEMVSAECVYTCMCCMVIH